MKPVKPLGGWPGPEVLLSKLRIPGAPEEKFGALLKPCLKEGGGPAAGGGRGGSEACGCGAGEAMDEAWEALRPGGGG